MKILVDADTRLLLGAAILGLNGDEVVHSLLDVMYAGLPIRPSAARCISTPRCPNWCRRCCRDCGR
jgi:pyruvate/2-oxoglutarate dehydrogenase complex dihydrolipoamide dehydrogenase (E3) component